MGKYTLKALLITLALVFIAPEAPACASSTAVGKVEDFPKVTSRKWTSKYDQYFKKYTKRYFGVGFEWKWFDSAMAWALNHFHSKPAPKYLFVYFLKY